MIKPLLVSLTVLTAAFAPYAQAADEKIPSERVLPPEVLAYVSLPNVPEFKERWSASSFGRMVAEPELQDFLEDLEARLEQFSLQVQQQTGLTLNDLWQIPQGDVTFAALRVAGELEGVGLIDFGESGETVDRLLEQAKQELADQGGESSQEVIDGAEVTVYTMPSENEQQDPPTFAYFLRDSHFVVASDVAALKAVLARWDGTSESTFANHDTYSYILEQCSDDDVEHQFKWFFDPMGMLQAAIASVGQQQPQAQLFLGVLPVLGLDKLKGVGGTYDMARDDFDTVSQTFIYVDQPRTGVMNMFKFPAVEQRPPNWVAEDVSLHYAINWNLAEAYGAVETLFDMFNGPGQFAKMVDSLAEKEGGAPFHPKDDLIDELTGVMHLVGNVPQDANATAPPMLFALELVNTDAMRRTLARTAESDEFNGDVREFRGESIYEFPIEAEGVGETAGTMGVAIADGHLMLSNDVTMVERVLRGGTRRSLAESEAYRRIAEHLPDETSISGYQNQNSQLETAYKMLRSGEAAPPAEGIDFSKLPPFEVVKKYLTSSGFYAVPDRLGARFVSFSLRAD